MYKISLKEALRRPQGGSKGQVTASLNHPQINNALAQTFLSFGKIADRPILRILPTRRESIENIKPDFPKFLEHLCVKLTGH